VLVNVLEVVNAEDVVLMSEDVSIGTAVLIVDDGSSASSVPLISCERSIVVELSVEE